MTCREFKHIAASFSLRELARQQDAPMLDHIQSCAACEAWMSKQRSLNASLHTLRTQTASLEAGPNVEGALLRVFRQGIPVANVPTATAKLAVVAGTRASAGVTERKSQAASHSTPFALRLSRFFEVGAYAAVAAAVLVGLFLGAHLLKQSHNPASIQSKSLPMPGTPAISTPEARQTSVAQAVPKRRERTARYAVAFQAAQQQTHAAPADNSVAADDTQADADAGYMALMFCDPLSCASDTQVVRMELPPSAGGQPEMADVVVGYDGLVRAVRFVN
jgi:hypothetical protein